MQEIVLAGTNMGELGRAVRDIREASNLTAEQLVEIAGCLTRPSLTRFETGKATAPSFNTVYRILRAIGKLNIVKNGDFDFGPYDKEIVDLIHYFIEDDKETTWVNYGNVASKQIAEGCEHWSKDELHTILFLVQCKNGRDDINRRACKLDNALLNYGMDMTCIDHEELSRYIINETDFVLRLKQFLLNLKQDDKYTEVFELVGELIDKTYHYVCRTTSSEE